jgi:hypothetical protein
MNANSKTDTALPMAVPVSADVASSMPEAFVGVFLVGFEAGYSIGNDTGYRNGFAEGYAAAHKDAPVISAVTTAFEGKPAPKHGPRRMLLGMPCPKCKVYLHTDETNCPSCKQRVE